MKKGNVVKKNTTNDIAVQEFQQVHSIISQHRLRALQTVNSENLITAWNVGAFVSERLKNSAWGSKTVMQLSEYLRTQDPTLRGFSRSSIYNMVLFYDTYSSSEFQQITERLNLGKFVQAASGQIVQFQTAQFPTMVAEYKRQLIPKEVLQRSLDEFCDFLG